MKTMEVIVSEIVLVANLSTKMFVISMIFNTLMVNHTEEFIDWMLDLVDYFSYAKVFEHFKVFFVSRILESDVANWWNDIQYIRRRR